MTTPFKLLVFTLVMALSVIPCYAQYENYYKVDNNTYVTTMPNAEIYELQSNCITPNCREIINTQNSKTKKIKRPQQLRVLRYTNTLKQRDFNAYVVEYKDKEWVLQDSYVQDNTLLKQRSNQMIQSQESITTNHQDLEKQLEIKKQQFNELLLSYKSQCADSMNYYKELKSRLPAIRDSLVAVKRAQEQAKVDKVYKEWYNAQPASTKRAANIISISSAELGYPNSAGGCDYTLLYTNKSKKTIKYLYWSGTTYNAVNDPVYCEIRSTSYFSGKDTGPVEYNEVGGGSWDCIIYNYSADRLKLENISITYRMVHLQASVLQILKDCSKHHQQMSI